MGQHSSRLMFGILSGRGRQRRTLEIRLEDVDQTLQSRQPWSASHTGIRITGRAAARADCWALFAAKWGWTTIIRRVIACADGGPGGIHTTRSKQTAAIPNAQDEIDGSRNGGGWPGKSKEPCESQRGGKAAVIQPQLLSYSFASHFDLHPIMGPAASIHESVNPLIPAPTFRASLNRSSLPNFGMASVHNVHNRPPDLHPRS